MWVIGFILQKLSELIWRFRAQWIFHEMESVGKNCHIDGPGSFSANHISLGNNVFIGSGGTFVSSIAHIRIGNDVMIGPNVMIVTGNHRFDVKGKTMIEVTEKRPEDDQDVVIEDDCWIGMNALILKGVNIGKGSVIGAGSIITKSIPPYSIVYSHQNNIEQRRFKD